MAGCEILAPGAPHMPQTHPTGFTDWGGLYVLGSQPHPHGRAAPRHARGRPPSAPARSSRAQPPLHPPRPAPPRSAPLRHTGAPPCRPFHATLFSRAADTMPRARQLGAACQPAQTGPAPPVMHTKSRALCAATRLGSSDRDSEWRGIDRSGRSAVVVGRKPADGGPEPQRNMYRTGGAI
jgi:hypothetical protein